MVGQCRGDRDQPDGDRDIDRITMENFKGETLSWELKDGCIELALHREPANEIG